MKWIQLILLFLGCLMAEESSAQLWKQWEDEGNAFISKNEIDSAIKYYGNAQVELNKDSLGTINYALCSHYLGVLYIQKGDYQDAEPQLLEARRIRDSIQGKGSVDYEKSCYNLGLLYCNTGQFDKAEPLLTEANRVFGEKLGKDHLVFTTSCTVLGYLFQSTGQYSKAEPFYIELLEAKGRSVGKEHLEYATACNSLAVLYYYMGLYDKSERLHVEGRRIREKLLDCESPEYADNCLNLGNLYQSTGQFDKAWSLFIEAKTIRERISGKNNAEYALCAGNLGRLFNSIGRYKDAKPLLLEAKSIYEKLSGKNSIDYAYSCMGLGDCYLYLNEMDLAEQNFVEGREIRRRLLGPDHPDYATSCSELAYLYLDLGQSEKAKPLYEEALRIREKVFGKESTIYASTCENLGDLYFYDDDDEKAESLFLEALHIFETKLGKDNLKYASVCRSLGILYMNWKQVTRAEPLLLKSMEIRGKAYGKESPNYATSLHDLGDLYFYEDKYDMAEPFFLEERNIDAKNLGRGDPSYIGSCIGLGVLYWAKKDYSHANAFYREAIQIQNDRVKKIFAFTNEEEKKAFLVKVRENTFDYLSYAQTVPSKADPALAYDISLFNRNMILGSSQQMRASFALSIDNSMQIKYDHWINLRKELAALYVMPPGQGQDKIRSIEEESNLLEKDLSRLSGSFKNEKERNDVSWTAIRENLQANEAAIEFVQYQYFNGKWWTDSILYSAVLIRKDSPKPIMVPLFEKRQLDSLIDKRNTSPGQHQLAHLYSAKNAVDQSGSSTLFSLIWQPIEKELEGIKTVYLAPAGDLHKIAFAALPLNDHQVLSDKYELVQLNTTASILNKTNESLLASDRLVLYGGIRYDADPASMKEMAMKYKTNDIVIRSETPDMERGGINDFVYLSESQKEVRGIEGMAREKKFSVTVLDGIAGSEESFKSLSGKNSPAIIHLATHGYFSPDPSKNLKGDVSGSTPAFKGSDNPLIRTGLALAGANNAWKGNKVSGIEDGILTAYEVSNMYLPNTKLVVLSACETGLGDIQGSEGVYGLQRAFKMAGVQNLVMSLWKVDDLAASEFMQEFYKNLFKGKSIRDAFNESQSALKAMYRNDPYNWAGWILVR